jgi:hypothetical protein
MPICSKILVLKHLLIGMHPKEVRTYWKCMSLGTVKYDLGLRNMSQLFCENPCSSLQTSNVCAHIAIKLTNKAITQSCHSKVNLHKKNTTNGESGMLKQRLSKSARECCTAGGWQTLKPPSNHRHYKTPMNIKGRNESKDWYDGFVTQKNKYPLAWLVLVPTASSTLWLLATHWSPWRKPTQRYTKNYKDIQRCKKHSPPDWSECPRSTMDHEQPWQTNTTQVTQDEDQYRGLFLVSGRLTVFLGFRLAVRCWHRFKFRTGQHLIQLELIIHTMQLIHLDISGSWTSALGFSLVTHITHRHTLPHACNFFGTGAQKLARRCLSTQWPHGRETPTRFQLHDRKHAGFLPWFHDVPYVSDISIISPLRQLTNCGRKHSLLWVMQKLWVMQRQGPRLC